MNQDSKLTKALTTVLLPEELHGYPSYLDAKLNMYCHNLIHILPESQGKSN